ncbi:hypothetical protein PV326_007486 [Microctonus aethiopoides]|nr:hypothetical protein PV326_007486 [Microctonus aethiopoides]
MLLSIGESWCIAQLQAPHVLIPPELRHVHEYNLMWLTEPSSCIVSTTSEHFTSALVTPFLTLMDMRTLVTLATGDLEENASSRQLLNQFTVSHLANPSVERRSRIITFPVNPRI